jgi:hypothetical protein
MPFVTVHSASVAIPGRTFLICFVSSDKVQGVPTTVRAWLVAFVRSSGAPIEVTSQVDTTSSAGDGAA